MVFEELACRVPVGCSGAFIRGAVVYSVCVFIDFIYFSVAARARDTDVTFDVPVNKSLWDKLNAGDRIVLNLHLNGEYSFKKRITG